MALTAEDGAGASAAGSPDDVPTTDAALLPRGLVITASSMMRTSAATESSRLRNAMLGDTEIADLIDDSFITYQHTFEHLLARSPSDRPV